MIIKQIHSQDAFYKLSPRKSGETSLNISNELLQLIAPSLTKGNNMTISFILYREDYLKAIGVIFNSLPFTRHKLKCTLPFSNKYTSNRL